MDVIHGVNAAGIGHWQPLPLAESFYQGDFNPPATPFHVHGVDEKLETKTGQPVQQIQRDRLLGKGLPPVGDHHVVITAFSAAQIQHQPTGPDAISEPGEPVHVDAAVVKNPGGNDNGRSAGVEPVLGIVDGDPAADLHALRPGGQGHFGRHLVSGAKLNDVAAGQAVLAISFGKPCRRPVGGKIGLHGTVIIVIEAAADNLFDLSIVQVDAGPEAHGLLRKVCRFGWFAGLASFTLRIFPLGNRAGSAAWREHCF